MRTSLRLLLGLSVLLLVAACSAPTAPRLPKDGKDPKDPPPDGTAFIPPHVPTSLA
jgi:hypothetical protein